MKLNLAVAATLLALTTGSAFADNLLVDLTSDSLDTLNITQTTTTHSLATKGEPFVDDYLFFIGSKSDIEVDYSILPGKKYGLSFTSFTLTRGTSTTAITPSSTDVGELLFSGLKEGKYKLEVIGSATGKSGGSYTLGLSATPAVPEPEAVALAFAGLGVVGALARRRKTV